MALFSAKITMINDSRILHLFLNILQDGACKIFYPTINGFGLKDMHKRGN